jgi:hypothetical protein
MRAVNVMQRVPFWADAGWNLPLLGATVAVLLAMLLLWPIQAIVRWRHQAAFPHAGRRAMLYRLTRVSAVVQLLAFGVWAQVLTSAINVYHIDVTIDPLLRTAQAITFLGVVGTVIELWNLVAAWTTRPSGWWTKLSTLLVALAGLAFAWFAVTQHLLGPGTLF